jgi:hypothetical protein
MQPLIESIGRSEACWQALWLGHALLARTMNWDHRRSCFDAVEDVIIQ